MGLGLVLGLCSVAGPSEAQPLTRVVLNGQPVPVFFSDGDSFGFRGGPFSGANTRMTGYNTLESFGPVHSWGDWHAKELYVNAKMATLNARRGTWTCTTDGDKDGYGRILVHCPGLAEDQIRKGYAHVMTVTDDGGNPAYIAAQREAKEARRGMWAHGIPDYVLTSIHSAEEDTSGRGRALNSMSVVSLYFGDYETAVREAEGALSEQFYASRFSALSNLGWAYFQQDKLVEAMAELREAVRMNPDHCVSRYRLAEVYFRYGMANESQALISGILEDADCPIQEAHALQGEILAVSGDISSSRVAYQACVEAAPRSCVARDCFERARVGVVASERNVTR